MRSAGTAAIAILMLQLSVAQAETLLLTPLNDSSIFSGGDNAGSGRDVIYVGRNNGGSLRRGLIQFDIAGSLPAGATITGAALVFHQDNDRSNTVGLHRITADWGKVLVGSGGSGGGGGQGEEPVDGVVTWNYRFYDEEFIDGEPWITPGGDFVSAASAIQSFAPTAADPAQNSYTWSGHGMVDDLQHWLDNPAENFGWMMVGIESGNTLARLYSSESSVAEYRPELTVEYAIVPEPSGLVLVWGGVVACRIHSRVRTMRA